MSDAFVTKIRKIGSSAGIIIPRKVLEKINVDEGDEVVVQEIKKMSVDDVFGMWKGARSFSHRSEDRKLA